MLLIMLAVVLIFFTITKGSILWTGNMWSGMMMQFPEFGLITLGMMFTFICGQMDLSVIALGDFAAIIACKFIIANSTEEMGNGQLVGIFIIGILIAVIIAICGGLVNGFLVTGLDIPPVMATIAMQLVWQGLSIALTRGDAVTGLPLLYTEIGHSKILGFIPFPLLIFIIGLLIAAFLVKKTTYGEKLYMIGTNQKACVFSAINVKFTIIITYCLCSVYSVIGCMLMVNTLGSAKADYGTSYLMRCILILVLAGILPDGGYGNIWDSVLAIIIIQIIASGVNMFKELNTYWSSLIWGAMLIVVLILSTRVTGNAPKKKKADVTAKAGS